MRTLHILGAGPAGLSLAYYLKDSNFRIHVYEKASIPGGMARSWSWDNFIVDTGPHILHTPVSDIWEDWFSIIGDDLVERDFFSANLKRKSDADFFFDYPLNVNQVLSSNYWSIGERRSIDSQIQKASQTEQLAKATSFAEYVEALVGVDLANEFFTIYPEKVWGIPTTEMLPDWAPKRVRVVQEREPFFGDQYSGVCAKGTGYLFKKIVEILKAKGHSVYFDSSISGLQKISNKIVGISVNSSQEIHVAESDVVVSTLPVSVTSGLLGLPFKMPFRGIASTYISFEGIKNVIPDPYHWLYFSDQDISFNRITEPTKLAPQLSLLDEDRTYIICETTFNTLDYLNGSLNTDIFCRDVLAGLQKTFLGKYVPSSVASNIEPYVYPLQTHGNKLLYKQAEAFLGSFANLEFLGTSANYAYNDLQVIFQQAKELSKDLIDDMTGFSSLSRSSFARRNCRVSEPNYLELPSAVQPRIIAEIGINHNGSNELLYELIDKSFESADLIKLQLFDSTMRIGHNVREINHVESAQDIEENILELLHRCELSPDTTFKALEYIASAGKSAMCTPFDISSLKLLLQWGITNIKISSMDLNNIVLHHYLCQYDKPLNLYISTGMSSLDEVKIVASMYSNTFHNVTFMLCNSSYPTPEPDLNLLGLSNILDLGFAAGYSDHTIGLDACLHASILGATCLEVHFTDNKYQTGPDQLLSKNEADLRTLKNLLAKQVTLLGRPVLGYSPSEYPTWRTQKKSLYARTDLPVGSRLTLDNTFLSSPPLGISPLALHSNNFVVTNFISSGSPICMTDLIE